jgi:hypothetical protein
MEGFWGPDKCLSRAVNEAFVLIESLP